MKKLKIYEALSCNRVLYKIYTQKNGFAADIAFKLYKIMKSFEEVEEFVMNTMEATFNEFSFELMTEEQSSFYNALISSEIELNFNEINEEVFVGNTQLNLTLEDIECLSIILKENNE